MSHFILNSDYPMDNVVIVFEGYATLSGISWRFRQPHDLPYMPLPFGIFSTDGGITWGDIDHSSRQSSGSTSSDESDIICNIYFYSSNPDSVKVRLFGFAPSNAVGGVIPPNGLSNFHLNTENSYDAIIEAGVKSLTSSQDFQIVTTYSLGYIPRVMLWYEFPGIIQRIIGATDLGDGYAMIPKVTTTDLQFKSQGESLTLHYRIYGAENG